MRSEFFGSAEQRVILRRGRGTSALLGQDVRYTYYGRTVGLMGPEDGDIDQLATLAMVQGSTPWAAVSCALWRGLARTLSASRMSGCD